jgi:hypothetical protein
MTAHDPVNLEIAVSDKNFYERFIEFRLKLKILGAEIVSVHHANQWVDVEWLPQGADGGREPIRSTLFRLPSECETKDFAFLLSEGMGTASVAI